jgi:acetate kinase
VTADLILAVNSGSSSLKVGLFTSDPEPVEIGSIVADGIGSDNGRVRSDGQLRSGSTTEVELQTHDAAITLVLARLTHSKCFTSVTGVGHRVVHGGRRYVSEWHRVDDPMLQELNDLIPLAPEHLPQAIAAIQAFREAFQAVPHVACFDTAFHRTLPSLARRYPMPHTPETSAIARYGFHGLSCESVLDGLEGVDPALARRRIVIAHLGNGASMTAVLDGHSIETTMGFTPTGGLMMGTRTGDLDPGVLLYLLTEHGISPDRLRTLVNKQSGLKGVSGRTSEMRELLDLAPVDVDAASAIDLYCYLARKQLGGLIAVLGGIDLLVFTGGIGERAAGVRSGICTGLAFAGIELDEKRNQADDAVISGDGATVSVRIIPTDEDRMIARHTLSAIQGGNA